MNKLTPINYENQRIMTTKVLAEQFGTEETNIQKNFNNNEKRFIEGKHYYKLEGQILRDFKNSLPNEIQEPLKFAPKLILWTDRGAARHAKILDTDEAWEVYEDLEENYFNPKNVQAPKKLSAIEQIKLQNEALIEIDGKVDNLGERISAVENNMTIDYGQQLDINNLAKKKVVAILGGKDTPAYKELNKKAFSQIWKDYKRIMQVNSYKNTAVKDIDMAKKVIIEWQPNRELELMIRGCNAQIKM